MNIKSCTKVLKVKIGHWEDYKFKRMLLTLYMSAPRLNNELAQEEGGSQDVMDEIAHRFSRSTFVPLLPALPPKSQVNGDDRQLGRHAGTVSLSLTALSAR